MFYTKFPGTIAVIQIFGSIKISPVSIFFSGTYPEISNVIAAPFWSTIEKQEPRERERLTYLRNAFASLMVTGPFSILVGYTGGLMALNDRLKLRSMVVGEKDETVYIASEECAIRVIAPELDKIWAPRGGEAVIVNLNDGGNK